MMRTMKRFTAIMLILTVLCGMTMARAAEPRVSDIYTSQYALLRSSQTLRISATTAIEHTTLRISYCWLEFCDDGEWLYLDDIPAACTTVHNTSSISVDIDISALISYGKYRVGYTIMCDGLTNSGYSNEQVF